MANVVRAGESPQPPFSTAILMRWASLRILESPATWNSGDEEIIALPLEGSWRVGGFELHGRESVFAGMTDAAYFPPHSEISFDGRGRIALLGARASVGRPARRIPAEEMLVVLRGSGQCSRQVVDFANEDRLDAERILGCEGFLPAGNWSSYPPHKHDSASETETQLEEIYYFWMPDGGFGYQQVSSSPAGDIEVLAHVHCGDAVLVPYGWHGPTIAPPGNALYYLNVMAGPIRSWRTMNHPEHDDIRRSWVDQEFDPRLPLVLPPSGILTHTTRAI